MVKSSVNFNGTYYHAYATGLYLFSIHSNLFLQVTGGTVVGVNPQVQKNGAQLYLYSYISSLATGGIDTYTFSVTFMVQMTAGDTLNFYFQTNSVTTCSLGPGMFMGFRIL